MSLDEKKPGAMARRGLGDLGVRAASAIVLVAAAVSALMLDGAVFVLFWLAAALAVHWEWQRLISAPLPWIRTFAGSFALCGAAALQATGRGEAAIALMLAAAGFCAWAAGRGYGLWAPAGVLYASGLLLATVGLGKEAIFGSCAIGWLFAVVWGTDVCAYFGGRLIGGAKLWPRISPGKTWSGFLVGVFCGAAIGAATANLWHDVHAPIVPLFLLGLATGAVAQGGDLFESWIKRRFGVKDSSRLIPGHGGVMDRLDGFIAATVFAALFGLAHGQPGAAAGLFHWP